MNYTTTNWRRKRRTEFPCCTEITERLVTSQADEGVKGEDDQNQQRVHKDINCWQHDERCKEIRARHPSRATKRLLETESTCRFKMPSPQVRRRTITDQFRGWAMGENELQTLISENTVGIKSVQHSQSLLAHGPHFLPKLSLISFSSQKSNHLQNSSNSIMPQSLLLQLPLEQHSLSMSLSSSKMSMIFST
jgi:hypothetical protein